MNCPDCQDKCCNHLVHELRNGIVSLSYCVKETKAGRATDELVERMESQVARIEKALKSCIRTSNEI